MLLLNLDCSILYIKNCKIDNVQIIGLDYNLVYKRLKALKARDEDHEVNFASLLVNKTVALVHQLQLQFLALNNVRSKFYWRVAKEISPLVCSFQAAVLLLVNVCCANRCNVWLFLELRFTFEEGAYSRLMDFKRTFE